MSIALLKDKFEETTEFKLGINELVLLVILKDQSLIYLLNDPKESDLNIIDELDNISEMRIIGNEKALTEFLSLNNKSLSFLKKKKTLGLETPILFLAQENQVKFKKVKAKEKNNVNEKKKVLIIDDSTTIQKLLTKTINSSEKLEVAKVASGPSEAKEILKNFTPDVITLDIHMPEMDGVTLYKTFLKDLNIPVACISSISISEGPLVLEALSSGVLTYIQKPDLKNMINAQEEIIDKLEAIMDIKQSDLLLKGLGQLDPYETANSFDSLDGLIAIGSSTGGTQALEAVLSSLPDEIPPIVIVQHIPEVFSKALADRLDEKCPFKIKEVEHNDLIEKNSVYIAKGGVQFKLRKVEGFLRAVLRDDPAVNSFKPSVDYLFESICQLDVDNGIGVILTGMGRDGAKGLLKLKEKGFHTIAQDEASSIVYGMPKVALEMGATKEVVSLSNIANSIVNAYNRYHK